ncbi:MAG TPA: SpoIID/LytB domain-containing protein, partial [Mycobacteriales bacterium]|nr:SpoIID/LytB domain-containing protein [Mycobacteriales bacterium]
MTAVMRGLCRVAGFAVVLAGLAGPAVAAPASPPVERYPVPPGGVFTIAGHGYGHGHGMSQWGAYGAARRGLSAHQIVRFYYPHTTLQTEPASRPIRVLLSAADAPHLGYVQVLPAPDLKLGDGGKRTKLPTQSPKHGYPITSYRLQLVDTALALKERWNGHWHQAATEDTSAVFRAPGGLVTVDQPNGPVSYRGILLVQVRGGQVELVNQLPLESYLGGVVPSEMPASWPVAALRAQAIAARTYAARGMQHPKTHWFDVFGDTRDQAYGGESHEVARATAAVAATAGQILVDDSDAPVLAQYSAADGGWTVSGGQPYLPAQKDPYDGVVPNQAHSWTTSRSASTIAAAYPQIGTLRAILVTARDGNGSWGGRVTELTLRGSAGSTTTSGGQFAAALGLMSDWFRPTPTPAAPRHLTATVHSAGKKHPHRNVTVTWRPSVATKGAAAVTGYRVVLTPASGSPQHVSVDAATA